VRVVRADESDRRARDHRTYDAWGARYSLEQYLELERRLRAHPFAREALATWLLIADDGAVLSSCETYEMQSFASGGPGVTLGVASVFTERRLRGRGYASQLLTLLAAEAGGAHALILFSDVGAPLYERIGYVARPASDLVFPPAAGDPSAVAELYADSDVAEALATVSRPNGGFLVWPTAAQLDWHLERDRTFAALAGRTRVGSSGARAGDGIALWAGDSKRERLQVLLFLAPDREAATALGEAARRAAARADLKEVRVWACPDAAALGGRGLPREGSLPMLRPLAAGVRPEDWTFIPRAIWV